MDKEKMQEQTEETVENTEVKEENTAEDNSFLFASVHSADACELSSPGLWQAPGETFPDPQALVHNPALHIGWLPVQKKNHCIR